LSQAIDGLVKITERQRQVADAPVPALQENRAVKTTRYRTAALVGNGVSRQPSKGRAPVFCKYVEHQTVASWTWRRIAESRAERIIALGHIAEHGLLRLLSRHGARISFNGRQWYQDGQSEDLSTGEWVDRYADEQKTLGYWLTPGRWWTVFTQGRNLRLLPVYHPARVEKYDRGYTQTGDALAAWLRR
jgi:uracil-DNA glycosylase